MPERRSRGRLARRIALAGAGALALAGCAMAPQLERVAVDHNRMVAAVEDELTLLNIVRASRRFPLHFTAISEVNGNAEIAVDASVSTTLSPGADPVSPRLGGRVATKPSFRAGVLSNEAFQRGIQQPVAAELVAYYLDSGWRDELIMALFVERVDIVDPVRERMRVASIVNEPDAASPFAGIICHYRIVSEPTSASRPLARFGELVDSAALAEGNAASRREEVTALLKLLGDDGVTLADDTLFLRGSNHTVRFTPLPQQRCAESIDRPDIAAGYELVPRFRSTLGIIYALGEYIRVADELGPKAVYRLPDCGLLCRRGEAAPGSRPLIDVRRGSGRSLLATELLGHRFYIPAEENLSGSGARSMQVVAAVQQLLNLHKSADALPASISLTGVN